MTPSTSILDLAASGRGTDVMRSMRVRALHSPFYFAKIVLGYNKLTTSLHLPETELFVSRWAAGYNRQVIEWPRAFYKSTSFTIATSMWGALPVSDEDRRFAETLFPDPAQLAAFTARCALHNQDVTQLVCFETESNAIKKLREIRWHYEQNELFRALFPEIAYAGRESPWNDKALKQRRVGYAQRSDEGTFEAIGVGGALQSRHFDRMWLDDLVGKAARDSQTVMEGTLEWFDLLYGAFTSAKLEDQTRFVIGNRWAYFDLNAHIRKQENVHFYTRRAIEIGEDGTEHASCPEILTLDDIARLRREMSEIDFSCQYLNEPISPGERDLDASALHRYTISDGFLVCSCGDRVHIESTRRYMHYDPYNDKKSSTSRPALVVVAVSPTNHVYLLHTFTLRARYSEIFDHIFTLAERWRVHNFTYEDVGAQNMTEFYIRERARRSSTAFPPISGLKVGNKPKELRIRDYFYPVIRAGRFSVPTSNTLLGQMLATFPSPSFDHDYDVLDALAQGATVWRAPASDDTIASVRSAARDAERALAEPYTFYTPPPTISDQNQGVLT